jgi:4-hydroxythreonine-4-phosphate dehydrogenase
MSQERPKIGLVMGDAAGIGPELILKALTDAGIHKECDPLVLGSHEVLSLTCQTLGLPREIVPVAGVDGPVYHPSRVCVLDCTTERIPDFQWGVADARHGRNCIAAMRKGMSLASQGKLDGLVLAPLNKEAMHLAGNKHPDEFGLLAELAGVPRVKGVVKWGDFYRSTVVGHVAFRDILAWLTVDEIVTTVEYLGRTIQSFGVEYPQIGIAALNPHAGDGGQFGDEEQAILTPAIREARRRLRCDVSGPYPADTIWHRAVSGPLDGIVYLYHDQGNIGMKAAAFGEAVLIYAGLPFCVTSTEHGTAYDIAGQGRADHGNLVRALEVAIDHSTRQRRESWSAPE